ncbi:MAG: multicopper oxidase domain-containing protein [Sphingobacteriaceae bacterium]|nr:multicopper oxidase domain-containing protein [Sphingobacteriaceae bacterium]
MKRTILTVLGLFLISNSAFSQTFSNSLAIPSTLTGTNISLSIHTGTMAFYPGFSTNSIGFNAYNYLGPTLILNKGDSVHINVTNNLIDTTTIHWHGMHVSPKNDGGPHTVIPPATTWTPKFKVRDDAAMFWYHSHLHMNTAAQVTKGEAGLIIVKDPIEAALTLPRTYGVDDIPLVVQTRAFDVNKQFDALSAVDSVVLINGTKNPYTNLPAQVVRLRLINAATMRLFNFGFSNNATFYQIVSDGGLLSAPVSMTRLRLAPGERAEILLDLTALQTQTIYLTNYGSQLPNGYYGAANPAAMGMGTIPNYSSNAFNGTDNAILKINVVAPTASAVTTMPSTLTVVTPFLASQANKTRTKTFSPKVMGPGGGLNGPFVINGMSFDMMMINDTVPFNNIEVWNLTNNTAIAHPFHIHDVQFYILDINGSAPPANMAGKKDVVVVPAQQTVKFITKFDDFTDHMTPYMYHCHMLVHEDEGMMGQFLVWDYLTDIKKNYNSIESIKAYPNPASSSWIIKVDDKDPILGYKLTNALGKDVRIVNDLDLNYAKEIEIDTKELSQGVYYLNVYTKVNRGTVKLIKQ